MNNGFYLIFETGYTDRLANFIQDDMDDAELENGQWKFFFGDYEDLNDTVQYIGLITDDEEAIDSGRGDEEDLDVLIGVDERFSRQGGVGKVVFASDSDSASLIRKIVEQLKLYSYCNLYEYEIKPEKKYAPKMNGREIILIEVDSESG